MRSQTGSQLPSAQSRSGDGVDLINVVKRFGETVAVSGADLSLPRHGRMSIIGPSGCGKSTILSMISGLLDPTEGVVRVEGATTMKERLARCAWMPQRDLLLPWRDVAGNAALALENHGISKKESRERVLELIDRFGLSGFERKFPHQLSGGMRQRVSFLRTMAAGKDVLLFDEPFGALDSITRADLQQWLRRTLEEAPRTTVLVTHDVEEALLLGDTVVVMSARPGRIVQTVDVELPQTENRRELIRHPAFAELRDELLSLLEVAE
ncbi:ABC transporter ATP-binding protein [Nocardioides sp. LHD-245]|uniref:ABC transporter ATP-binding protein n=1 Tax=Nocardioides sp. LHD-245 TaxID=3051387 RepID=UPI0027E06476|nr:ABC transporter ATP-binding protein [Nocardioides sp. LHD-245]